MGVKSIVHFQVRSLAAAKLGIPVEWISLKPTSTITSANCKRNCIWIDGTVGGDLKYAALKSLWITAENVD